MAEYDHPTDSQAEKRLLIVDDEKNMRHMLKVLLETYGYSVQTASDGQDALEKVKLDRFDFILCDLKMPRMDGMTFLKSAKAQLGSATVIMMSAYGTIETAIAAMKEGAYDYISKPFKPDEVYQTLKKAEERERLKSENRLLKKQVREFEKRHRFGRLVAKSDAMQAVFDLALKMGQYDTTVMISGESGTGKELIARAIHYKGKRSSGPFVPLNCGGIPEALLESELFGYCKGAFTGADHNRKGLFEEAQGGTIFLDEIGELPTPLQVKLLRVLQDREIRPLGETRPKTIDVRVIAATAKNLENEVRQGTFRNDLFYRLNVLPIKLPPLRDRMEDVPLLVNHFIDKFNGELQKDIREVEPAVMNRLMRYHWPGNVRELENVVERAMVLSERDTLRRDDLPPGFGSAVKIDRTLSPDACYSLKKARRDLEERMIRKALAATGGNRTHAARLLEISHPSLLSKMKGYGLS